MKHKTRRVRDQGAKGPNSQGTKGPRGQRAKWPRDKSTKSQVAEGPKGQVPKNRRVIIGAGSGNTGTHSIYHALTEFGFVTWHASKNKTWDNKRSKIRTILRKKPAKTVD